MRDDILDGALYGDKCIIWQNALYQAHQLFLKVVDRDVGNQGEKEDDCWENGQNKVKGNGLGPGGYGAVNDSFPEKKGDVIQG